MTPQVLHFPTHPQAITLRDYQQKSVDDLRREMLNGRRRVLLQTPTGGGKTIVASAIMKGAMSKDKRVLFLAHRRELVHQCDDKLNRFGVASGIIMAGVESNWSLVQVASVQTIHARVFRSKKLTLEEPDLIVIDEAHRSTAMTYRRVLDAFPDAWVLGLTATPVRGDGTGLGLIYKSMVLGPTNAELTKQGWLVPIAYYMPAKPDLSEVKTRAGDYVEEQLQTAMDKPKLVGDVVEQWCKHAAGRPTVVFATGVRHSMHLAEEFRREGIAAEHLDGTTPLDEREGILSRLSSGETQVVSNCMVLTEGWDCPVVSCCVLARPTKSLALFLQMAGRTLRPASGKADCLILDHAGSAEQFGDFITPWGKDHVVFDEVPWSLDGKEKLAERAKKKKKPRLAVVCEQCFALFSAKVCPNCGTLVPERQPQAVEFEDGELSRVRGSAPTMKDKARVLAELKGYALEKGFKNGWAMHSYRRIFGVWPHSSIKRCRWTTPSEEIRGWAIADWRARKRKLNPRKAAVK